LSNLQLHLAAMNMGGDIESHKVSLSFALHPQRRHAMNYPMTVSLKSAVRVVVALLALQGTTAQRTFSQDHSGGRSYLVTVKQANAGVPLDLPSGSIAPLNKKGKGAIFAVSASQLIDLEKSGHGFTILKSPRLTNNAEGDAASTGRISSGKGQRTGVTLSNEHVEAYVSDEGLFTAWRASDGKPILYPQAGSGFFSVNVDGITFSHFSNTLIVSSALTSTDAYSATITYLAGEGIYVKQDFRLEGEALGVYVSVSNGTPVPHDVKIRYLLDTQIDDNDGSPLYAPPVGTRTFETEVAPLNFTSWEAWLTPVAPLMRAIGTLPDIPSRVVFAWWPGAVTSDWDYTPNAEQQFFVEGYSGTPESDGCVLLYYDLKTIPSQLQSLPYVMYYGTGQPQTGSGSDRLKQALEDLNLALENYEQKSCEMFASVAAKFYKRIVEKTDTKEIAKDFILSLLAGDIQNASRKLIGSAGVAGAGTEAVEIILSSFLTEVGTRPFPDFVASSFTDFDNSWTEEQIMAELLQRFNGAYGFDFGSAGMGMSALTANTRQQFQTVIAGLPVELPPGYPLEETVKSIKSISANIRSHTPWDLKPTAEGHVYWAIPGMCSFDQPPLNPMLVGTSSGGCEGLSSALGIVNGVSVFHSIWTYSCVAWSTGGGIVKGVVSLASAGTGALPAEGVYWTGVQTCTAGGTILTGLDILSNTGLLLFFLDATKKVNSDFRGMYDFSLSVLNDVQAAVSTYGNSSAHYTCSPDVEIVDYSVSDVQLGFLQNVGQTKAFVTLRNTNATLTGTARAVVEVLLGDRIVGVYSSNNVSIPPGSTEYVSIDVSVPNSNLFFADKYLGRLVLMSSGGTLDRITAFRVCSPSACLLDDIFQVESGLLAAGETSSSQFQTTGAQKAVSFTLSYPGSDLDLHLYDGFGQHTGVNYNTGQIELGIPGSSYSGNTRNPETISVSDPGVQELTIEVVAVSTEGRESFSVMAIGHGEHPPTLVANPPRLNINAGASASQSISTLALAEIGRQQDADNLTWRIDDFLGAGGHTLPGSIFSLSLPAMNIPAGSSLDGTVEVNLSDQTPPDMYTANLKIESSVSTLTIPVSLVIDTAKTTSLNTMVSLPVTFALHQNYPNPFNPRTTIKFDLPQFSEVKLAVYDILGRELSVLVNEKREAGYHEVHFDASRFSSGVYFYRLRAGDFTETRRFLLIK